jgi:hypothetical protein
MTTEVGTVNTIALIRMTDGALLQMPIAPGTQLGELMQRWRQHEYLYHEGVGLSVRYVEHVWVQFVSVVQMEQPDAVKPKPN